ncbi:MAG: GNAT family N-acetyltransferase [Actinobacteria bacterium]|nr:GNAT family N-acetyltransferase [Actinomycetota bacterium]
MPDTSPSLATTASKAATRLKSRGLREVAALAWQRASDWVSSEDSLVFFVRDATPTDQAIPGLTFREATPQDAFRYARDIGTDSPSTFTGRLSPTTRCFVIDDGALLLHASWVTTAGAWTRELRAYVVPPGGEAYIYESFTRGEARGRGIYPFALHGVLAWGTANAIRRVWVAVEENNVPSHRAITKAGFVEAFRLPFARRFGRVEIGDATGPRASDAVRFLSRTPPR